MRRHPQLILLVILTASAASAQYDDEAEAAPELEGSSRFSLQTGWRYFPNTGFYDDYYSSPEHRGLPRSRGAIGGPLLAGSFAYSATNLIELGIDMFTTYERMALTGKPGLNSVTFGALIGLRFQTRLAIGPEGLIPFAGLLIGPVFAGTYFDGGRSVENFATSLGVAAGATLRLTPKWGLCAEYRFVHALGEAEDVGIFQAGGSWLAVGLTYTFPSIADRPLSRKF